MYTRIISVVMVLAFSFLAIIPSAEALVSVKGYYRSNGTYVAPHYRTSPDSITSNNFSTNGIKTTNLSQSTAASYERALNDGTSYSGYTTPSYNSGTTAYLGSKRERKVVKCQNTGKSEAYCKSIYMKKKHK